MSQNLVRVVACCFRLGEGGAEGFEGGVLDDLLGVLGHRLAVLALAAQQGAELTVATVDTGWTVDRAERYLRSLPAGARRFAEMVVVDGDGYIDAEQLRQVLGKLNGPTVALSRAVPRGVREGWWPEGISAPISPVWDPDNPSWHKNIAYRPRAPTSDTSRKVRRRHEPFADIDSRREFSTMPTCGFVLDGLGAGRPSLPGT
ncbi:hypothetical protein ACFY2M_45055 [Streptomyces sp. NPDC001276]|uniref:hypothetical protein n=1 Tax=Streptomyces sp. NPDC001276 TaxID=3364555 RepID=UPI0036BCA2C3